MLQGVNSQMEPLTHTKDRNLSQKKLVVCVHGLSDNPSQYKKIVDEMQKKDLSHTDLLIPHVLESGHASLDAMVQPILEDIKKWARTSDDKELVLVGISNGGRIARALEAEIAHSPEIANIKKIRFISIVGACKGSGLVDFANKIGLSKLMTRPISSEMPTDSERVRQLNQEWDAGLNKGPRREYTFFASPHDCLVTNYSSSLMEANNQNALYAIIPGHGHNSIVNAVATAVAHIVTQ